MRAVSRVPKTEPTEIDRHEMPATGKSAGIVQIDAGRITFGDLARFACPRKTAAWLADIAKCDVRTAERWLEGKHEPDADVLGAVMFEIMRRYQMRVSQ